MQTPLPRILQIAVFVKFRLNILPWTLRLVVKGLRRKKVFGMFFSIGAGYDDMSMMADCFDKGC